MQKTLKEEEILGQKLLTKYIKVKTPRRSCCNLFFMTMYVSSFILRQIYVVCGRVPWLYQYWPGGFMIFVVLRLGTPKGSTGSVSGFKASQKTGQRLKVSSDRLGEAGNRTCDPWFTRHRFIPYTTAASLDKCIVKGFSG